MTISKVIQYVDTNKPNAFSNEDKVNWLSELDAEIAGNIMHMSNADLQNFQYDAEDDMDSELLITFPHDKIYPQFLMARIDEMNGEYNRFANSSVLYNASYNDFVRWFLETWDPVQGCNAPLEE